MEEKLLVVALKRATISFTLSTGQTTGSMRLARVVFTDILILDISSKSMSCRVSDKYSVGHLRGEIFL